jgi:hypothetical protein
MKQAKSKQTTFVHSVSEPTNTKPVKTVFSVTGQFGECTNLWWFDLDWTIPSAK